MTDAELDALECVLRRGQSVCNNSHAIQPTEDTWVAIFEMILELRAHRAALPVWEELWLATEEVEHDGFCGIYQKDNFPFLSISGVCDCWMKRLKAARAKLEELRR